MKHSNKKIVVFAEGKNQRVERFVTPASRGTGEFIRIPGSAIKAGQWSGIMIPDSRRWMALSRQGLYWISPAFGTRWSALPREVQFLLWERTDGQVGLFLPLIDGDLRATLEGASEGVQLVMSGCLPGKAPDSAVLGFVAAGPEPYSLIHRSMRAVSDRSRTFRLREEKPLPVFADHLGWCTWDAFYGKVDERRIMQGLSSFKKGGLCPGFMILDDGWEQSGRDLLQDFVPQPRKFPRGLRRTIQRAKEEFGVKLFGVHHPFQGYWAGIDPKGKLGRRYRHVLTRGNIRPWLGKDNIQTLCLVHPDDIHHFYGDLYSYLRSEGADFVKVDGQSALELFTEGKLGRVSTMKAYQDAQQGAAGAHFNSSVIPCMSNGSDVAYHLDGTNGWRNSVDYFPGRPHDVQKKHINDNAYNAVWTSFFCLPDWDMFQSHQPESVYHAAARAVSGGPVYACDKPGRQNFRLLRKLCLSDSRILRCDVPAVVTADRLFTDCRLERRLLKVVSRTRSAGVMGIFHVHRSQDAITGSFSADDLLGVPDAVFAAYRHHAGTLEILERKEKGTITLSSMGAEIVTFAPIREGFAAIGLLDKYNSSGAVEELIAAGRGTAVVRMREGGRMGFYSRKRPGSVTVNGKKVRWKWDSRNGFLTVRAGEGKRVEVVLTV